MKTTLTHEAFVARFLPLGQPFVAVAPAMGLSLFKARDALIAAGAECSPVFLAQSARRAEQQARDWMGWAL